MEINSESNEMYMWLECIYEMVFRAGAFISSPPVSKDRQNTSFVFKWEWIIYFPTKCKQMNKKTTEFAKQ